MEQYTNIPAHDGLTGIHNTTVHSWNPQSQTISSKVPNILQGPKTTQGSDSSFACTIKSDEQQTNAAPHMLRSPRTTQCRISCLACAVTRTAHQTNAATYVLRLGPQVMSLSSNGFLTLMGHTGQTHGMPLRANNTNVNDWRHRHSMDLKHRNPSDHIFPPDMTTTDAIKSHMAWGPTRPRPPASFPRARRLTGAEPARTLASTTLQQRGHIGHNEADSCEAQSATLRTSQPAGRAPGMLDNYYHAEILPDAGPTAREHAWCTPNMLTKRGTPTGCRARHARHRRHCN